MQKKPSGGREACPEGKIKEREKRLQAPGAISAAAPEAAKTQKYFVKPENTLRFLSASRSPDFPSMRLTSLRPPPR